MDSPISDTFLDLAYGVWDKDDMMILDDADLEADFLDKHIDFDDDFLQISETDPDPLQVFSVDEIESTQQLEASNNICSERMKTSGCAQIEPHQTSFSHQTNEPQNTTYDSTEFRAKYNRALNNLASSMQQSELTRTQIIYQRQNQAHECNNGNILHPSSQSLSGLASLLSGRSSTLTVALEQSRTQLKSYMDSAYSNTLSA